MDSNSATVDAQNLIASVANQLLAAGARPEQLAVSTPAHRALGLLPRSESYRKAGEGFLLGALVITLQGEAFEAGLLVRASRQVLPGHQAQSAQVRMELKRRLLAAKFPENSAVLVDARRLPIDDPDALAREYGPLVLREVVSQTGITEKEVLVRWMPTAPDTALRPLEAT